MSKRPLRVIFMTQKLDEADWLNSFTVTWIRALAARVEQVDVIALEQRSTSLPTNVAVYSLGKEAGVGRLAELIAFERIIARRARHADVIFGHLTPRYTWLAAPWAILYRVPQCLWYTHRQRSIELRLALWSVRWVATAAPDSFPIDSPKVQVMGHGVDATRYVPGGLPERQPDGQSETDPPLILAVGRLAPIKRHDVLIAAAGLLQARGIRFRVAIAGATASPADADYRAQLESQIAQLGLTDSVQLLGGLPTDTLIGWLQRARVVTNLSPPGLYDKAVLEAALTARPVVVSNPAFNPLLAEDRALLYVPDPPDPALVADRLQALLALPEASRAAIGDRLRSRTLAQHSLDRLMDKLVDLWQQGRL